MNERDNVEVIPHQDALGGAMARWGDSITVSQLVILLQKIVANDASFGDFKLAISAAPIERAVEVQDMSGISVCELTNGAMDGERYLVFEGLTDGATA